MNFVNLDAITRKYMLQEIELDEKSNRLYISPRLSNQGAADYPSLLKAAVAAADDGFLVSQLNAPGKLNPTEPRNTKNGVTCGPRQKTPAHGFNRRNRQSAIGPYGQFIGDRSISNHPVALLHGVSLHGEFS
ncbi:MAG TPA: hypothetical protein VL991_12915 [Terracidiphilus sp.]|nr:hypothetical protein [Terracidiphilus sp.]